MATNETLIPIPGRLHSVATEGHVAGADEIYDDTKGKLQSAINADVDTAIGSDTTADSIKGRIKTLETDASSVDTRIESAVNALDAEKSQTAGTDGLALSITEVDGKITSISGSIASGTYATLDDGKVPASQLPSFVDDVLEYSSLSAFPATGETGKIYVALDTNLTYRWSGSAYVEISKSLALGETSSTAFAGDRGVAIENKIPSAASSSNKLVDNSAMSSAITSAVSTAKSEVIGDAASEYNTLGKLEDKIQEEVSRAQDVEATKASSTDLATEVNRATAAEQLLQEQYNALTQSDIIVGALPASGVANMIYRVPGESSYSDYMWNGSTWVLMATYNNAIDNEPTFKSENLVESGGVIESIGKISFECSVSQGTGNRVFFDKSFMQAQDKIYIVIDGETAAYKNNSLYALVTYDNSEDEVFTISPSLKYKYIEDTRKIKSLKMYIYNTSSLGSGYINLTLYCNAGIQSYGAYLSMLRGFNFIELSNNIIWGDGTEGEIISVTYNDDKTAITSISASHTESNTLVIQPTITYNTDGSISSRPDLQIKVLN